jgi:hypothetical protein
MEREAWVLAEFEPEHRTEQPRLVEERCALATAATESEIEISRKARKDAQRRRARTDSLHRRTFVLSASAVERGSAEITSLRSIFASFARNPEMR